MTDEQPVGFARGSIVREFGDGPNMLVVRSSADHTFVVVCDGDNDGTLRAREYPTGDLDQVLGNGAQQDREFDLRWKADMRAIARWRDANPGNDLVMPDHADLVVWLLDQLATGPVMPETPSEAARDVLAERRRQVEVEGWTPEHDDAHSAGEMARAAVCYALTDSRWRDVFDYRSWWPWSTVWWKPTTRRRDLVKAGALILAEIERIDRAALAKEQEHA